MKFILPCSIVVLFVFWGYVSLFTYTTLARSPIQLYRDSGFAESDGFRRVAKLTGLHHLPEKLPLEVARPLGLAQRTTACTARLRLGNLEREGEIDGGWNVCADRTYEKHMTSKDRWPPQDCVVYSYGGDYEFSFDISAARLGCEVHIFDPSMIGFAKSLDYMRLQKVGRIFFHQIGLSAAPVKPTCKLKACMRNLSKAGVNASIRFSCKCSWALEDIETTMHRLRHQKIEVLKIDVEGAEWKVLNMLTSGENPFLRKPIVQQLLVELHFPDVNPEQGIAILKNLSRENMGGLQLWSRDENAKHGRIMQWGNVHLQAYQELSYVRKLKDE